MIFLVGIVLTFFASSAVYWAALLAFLAVCVVSLRNTGVSSLLGAAGVSFLAPYYFLVDSSLEETSWN